MDAAALSVEPADPDRAYVDLASFVVSTAGHSFTFHPGGAARLEALLALIAGARSRLEVFYYLFAADGSGTTVRDALVAAAQRGVAVHLVVDDFGNDAGTGFFAPLTEAGATFAIFSPRWGMRYLVRNHQKFAIADGVRVLTGGANVSDHYFNPPAQNGWCDLAVVIEGPVVERFSAWFALLASWVAGEAQGRIRQLQRLRALVKQWDGRVTDETPGADEASAVRLLVGGPLVRRGHWASVFGQDLMRAQRLDTVSAYFAPPRSIRNLIAAVARRGAVRMVMAGKSDFGAAIDMARLLYGGLLKAGVRLFEFQPCKLHMKLLVADDISYVGSANLDKRSFRVNVELMVRIEDAGLAAELRGLIDHLAAASEQVTPQWYAQRATLLNRVRWQVIYWLSLADYRISRLATG
ncbi:MAG: cardiolipin synthase B [Porphyrobacter sp.]|jgi:cardiolipin synthase|nr:cardiolipin synthase B [Porphyrobacter sp.]